MSQWLFSRHWRWPQQSCGQVCHKACEIFRRWRALMPLEWVLEALRLSTVQLQNTFGTSLGARTAAMVRDYCRSG